MVQDSIKKKIHVPEDFEDLDEELNAQEYETYAQQVVDQATAAETVPELEAEITILKQLGTPIIWYWHYVHQNIMLSETGTSLLFGNCYVDLLHIIFNG